MPAVPEPTDVVAKVVRWNVSGWDLPQRPQIIIKEIRGKWGKFSEDDLSSLKNKDDLVTQRAAKYGLEKSVAQHDVDALMNGRQI